jgi:hypothetical protein
MRIDAVSPIVELVDFAREGCGMEGWESAIRDP